MSELPRGWALAEARDLAAPEPGSLTDGPFGSNLKTEHYVSDPGPRVIRLQNIGDGVFRGEDRAFITYARFESLRRHEARSGDVLIAALGDTLPRACLVPRHLGQAIVKADCFRLRPAHGVNSRFLQHILNAPQTHHAAATLISGVGRPRLNLGKVGDLQIPVAPTAEQDRIVAAIEEQFSRLDAGVAALERVRERLRLLRDQGLLALVSASGDLQRLGDVAEIRLGRQRSPKNHTGPRLRPYLRAANVTWNGLDLRDVKLMNFSSPESSIYELQRGDVLVAEASGSASEVGKPAIWDGSIANCCFQNTLLRVRSDRFLPEYLYFVLLAHARGGTFARASRGVGIHHLSKSGLSGLAVTLPTLAQQEAIVGRARSLQTAVARLLNDVEKQSARARTLRSAILAAAFSGNLVLQDPNDEPASTLLERIAAERASSNGHKPTRVGKPRTTRPKVSA